MFNKTMAILYILLYITPFSVLRYYPFLDKLRLPTKNVVTIFTALITLESGLFVYIIGNRSVSSTELQIYRMSWVIVFTVYSFSVINENFFKQVFLYLIVTIYGSAICGTSHFIEAHVFEGFTVRYPYTINNVAMLIQTIFTFPLMFILTKKHFKRLADSVETDIWKFIWLIPFMFYSIGVIFTINLSFAANWEYITARYVAFTGTITDCYVLLKTLEQLANNADLKEKVNFIDQQLVMQKRQYEALTVNIEVTEKQGKRIFILYFIPI